MRSLCYFVVIRLLILLLTTTVVASLDVVDFSDKFRRAVDHILGVKQFEVTCNVVHFAHWPTMDLRDLKYIHYLTDF